MLFEITKGLDRRRSKPLHNVAEAFVLLLVFQQRAVGVIAQHDVFAHNVCIRYTYYYGRQRVESYLHRTYIIRPRTWIAFGFQERARGRARSSTAQFFEVVWPFVWL